MTSIKPIEHTNFDNSKLMFGSVRTWTGRNNYVGKSVNTTYNGTSYANIFSIKLRAKVLSVYHKSREETPSEQEKARLYLHFAHEESVEFIKNIEASVIENAKENLEWFNNIDDSDEVEENIKSIMRYKPEYNTYNAYIDVSYDTKRSQVNGKIRDARVENSGYRTATFDVLNESLPKGTVVDLCISIRSLSIDVDNDEFQLKPNIETINIVGFEESGGSVDGIMPSAFDISKVSLGEVEKHPIGGTKYCRVNYNDKTFRGTIKNTTGRIFKKEHDDGKVTYSMNVDLNSEDIQAMYGQLSDKVYETLVNNSQTYYEKKVSDKKLSKLYTPFGGYGKSDRELIQNGEQPKYGKSLFIKLYYDADNGFGNKFKDMRTGEFVNGDEELVGNTMQIESVTFYNKHVWFGKTTTVSFSLDSCNYTSEENISYDMDSVVLPGQVSNSSNQNDDEPIRANSGMVTESSNIEDTQSNHDEDEHTEDESNNGSSDGEVSDGSEDSNKNHEESHNEDEDNESDSDASNSSEESDGSGSEDNSD